MEHTTWHKKSLTHAEVAAAGLPVRSIQWGAWSGMGMVATSAAVLARMQRGGISAIVPLMGLHALHSILHIGSSIVSAVFLSASTVCPL